MAMAGRVGLIDTAVKSVTRDTPIIVMEEGKTKHVMIGDWIDAQLDNKINKDKIKYYEEKDMELLDLENKSFIPTCDEDGEVTWGRIKAITRHETGDELYEIKKLGGKKVIVTE